MPFQTCVSTVLGTGHLVPKHAVGAHRVLQGQSTMSLEMGDRDALVISLLPGPVTQNTVQVNSY